MFGLMLAQSANRGRKLLLRVRDVMLNEGVPSLLREAPMRQCVVLLAEQRGTVAILDAAKRVLGVVTAGDLTRLMERTDDFLDVPVGDVMSREPKLAEPDELAQAAVQRLEHHGIMAMPVVDSERHLLGMVHLHDLMRAGAS